MLRHFQIENTWCTHYISAYKKKLKTHNIKRTKSLQPSVNLKPSERKVSFAPPPLCKKILTESCSVNFRTTQRKMEEEICQYDKFGFCKFRKECKRLHFIEECKDLDKCNSIKTCRKRHPKCCKRYDSGQCRY